jgi:hypothetical protein
VAEELLCRNQAITALMLAERPSARYSDDDPGANGWRKDLHS